MERRFDFSVDPDIGKASTLPAWIYSDPEVHERARDLVFARSWQLVGDLDRMRAPSAPPAARRSTNLTPFSPTVSPPCLFRCGVDACRRGAQRAQPRVLAENETARRRSRRRAVSGQQRGQR